MSKIAIKGATTGTGVFTLESPATNTDRTLVLPDEAGTVLTSASTVAQKGVPAFSAYQSSAQAVTANTLTKVNLQTEEFDTNNNFDTSRFTPTVAGYYQINASVGTTTTLGSTIYFNCIITKNGILVAQTAAYPAPANYFSSPISKVVYLNGTTDYVELYTQSNSNFNTWNSNGVTFLSGVLVRAA